MDDLIDREWCRQQLGRNRVGNLYSGDVWVPEIKNSQNGMDQWLLLPSDMTRTEALLVMQHLRIKRSAG